MRSFNILFCTIFNFRRNTESQNMENHIGDLVISRKHFLIQRQLGPTCICCFAQKATFRRKCKDFSARNRFNVLVFLRTVTFTQHPKHSVQPVGLVQIGLRVYIRTTSTCPLYIKCYHNYIHLFIHQKFGHSKRNE